MTPQQIFSPFLSHAPAFALLVGFYVLFRILRSATFKGWFGEKMVCRGLDRLDPRLYRHFHDLYLPRPDGQGTTQIDHVVVSPFGIFVIETKNYKGWIFGSEKQRHWTQQIYRKKSRFQNPLHQNLLHVKALVTLTGLPEGAFHSLVFFVGGADFKNPMPSNVISHGLRAWIENRSTPLLDPEAVGIANSRLVSLRLATDRKAARHHVRALEARKA